jgi:hypothetical protein
LPCALISDAPYGPPISSPKGHPTFWSTTDRTMAGSAEYVLMPLAVPECSGVIS